MCLLLYKVCTLCVNVFTNPVITYTKKAHKKRDLKGLDPNFRKLLIQFGKNITKSQRWVNKQVLRIQHETVFKPLQDELALSKGTLYFYQLPIYLMIILAPSYEFYEDRRKYQQRKHLISGKIYEMENRLAKIQKEIQTENLKIQKNRITVHPWPFKQYTFTVKGQLEQLRNIEPRHKITITFPNKRIHIYHLFTLL